ncbi:hypothetical protein [Nonomuraea sp. NPDC048916]|uniref:hypothetical protein n=1 Tax=Nonomuraea sp. NPDC048916 TaxID=3154232 RepID=UPI0033E5F094
MSGLSWSGTQETALSTGQSLTISASRHGLVTGMVTDGRLGRRRLDGRPEVRPGRPGRLATPALDLALEAGRAPAGRAASPARRAPPPGV